MTDIASLKQEYSELMQKAKNIQKQIKSFNKENPKVYFRILDNFDHWKNDMACSTLNGTMAILWDTSKDIIANIWQESYTGMFKSFDDEDVCYIIQQIHNRMKSFMKNIARLYYDAYDNKEFISYQRDNIPGEGFGSTLWSNYYLGFNGAGFYCQYNLYDLAIYDRALEVEQFFSKTITPASKYNLYTRKYYSDGKMIDIMGNYNISTYNTEFKADLNGNAFFSNIKIKWMNTRYGFT